MICLRTAGREIKDSSIDMETLIEVEAGIFFRQWFGYFPNLTGNINFLTHFLAQEKSELVMQHVGIKWHTSHPHS